MPVLVYSAQYTAEVLSFLIGYMQQKVFKISQATLQLVHVSHDSN